jgi:hypothetical protein
LQLANLMRCQLHRRSVSSLRPNVPAQRPAAV